MITKGVGRLSSQYHISAKSLMWYLKDGHTARVVAAAASLVPEAVKITLGRDLTASTPNDLPGILDTKGGSWLSDSHLLKYQGLLDVQPSQLSSRIMRRKP